MNNIPAHVAIIMDGNGRWAEKRGLARSCGHREGVKRVEEIVDAASRMGVKTLTLFAFSTENWSRPKQEVSMLMRLLYNFLTGRAEKLRARNIRFRVVGKKENLPRYLSDKLDNFQAKTAANTGMNVVLAFNYGSRQEIMDAARKYALDVLKRGSGADELNEEKFGGYLYTSGISDPDLLIRTSGEMRLSNFMLWQLSYAELYFSETFWPDFGVKEFEKALKSYARRQRRFGNIRKDGG